jgi:hypothetical protein
VWAPRVGSVGGGSGTNGHTGGWVSGGRSLRIRGGSVTGALPTIRGMRPPTQHLLEALARRRRAGDPFEDAWAPAVLSVVSQISDTDESVQWSRVFEATRSAWESSYERRRATRVERHLSLLADTSDREPIDATRTCAHCDGPVSPHPKGLQTKQYCSRSCRDRADYARRADVKNERRRQQRELARRRTAA